MNFGNGYLHFYFGEHWGVVIFAGTAFVAQLSGILYLYRRHHELAVKYRLLSQETDDIRNDLQSLRSVVVHVEESLNSVKSSLQPCPPSYYRSASDNLPSSSKSYSNPTSISHISSSESVYVDAVEEPFSPTNALNISTTSAASASELLMVGSKSNVRTAASTSQKSQFASIDQLLEQNEPKKALDECKKLYDSSPANQKNVELLWRYAKACYGASANTSDEAQKKKLLQDGQKFAIEGTKIDENNFNAVKFAAVTTGSLTDFLGTKEKIQQGHEFKKFLDKALSMKPTDHTLFHMRGRFSFSVASLSWFERKAASALFAEPPKATMDEAISDFLEVEKLTPGTWIENLVFLGKCYLAKGDKKLALEYLNKAVKLNATDEAEKALIAEAKTLIAKNSK